MKDPDERADKVAWIGIPAKIAAIDRALNDRQKGAVDRPARTLHQTHRAARNRIHRRQNQHFGWFAHFAGLDMPASSEWTRKTLNWNPAGPGLIEDLTNMKYF